LGAAGSGFGAGAGSGRAVGNGVPADESASAPEDAGAVVAAVGCRERFRDVMRDDEVDRNAGSTAWSQLGSGFGVDVRNGSKD